MLSEWKVGKKHRHYHACKQKHSLRPGLLGKFLAPYIEVTYAFVPGIDRYKSHSVFITILKSMTLSEDIKPSILCLQGLLHRWAGLQSSSAMISPVRICILALAAARAFSNSEYGMESDAYNSFPSIIREKRPDS